MTTFYLVRHAHADWSTDEDRRLSRRGYQDTIELGFGLGRYPITIIYSSPYTRARETVGTLSLWTAVPVAVESDLRERALGDFGDGDFNQAVEATWRDPSFAYPGGESNEAAQHRGVDALRRMRVHYPDDYIVVSTHGNLMALMLQHFDPSIDFAFWRSLTMPDVYELQWPVEGEIGIRRLMLPDPLRVAEPPPGTPDSAAWVDRDTESGE
jgi:2,3-bisphosphoglycerate-dependent phosphoglycerate mutase